MRAALHAHILVWFRRRRVDGNFKPVDAVPRTAPGVEPRQRPLEQNVEPLKEKQEDTCYQYHQMARVTAELVRPDVSGDKWGG